MRQHNHFDRSEPKLKSLSATLWKIFILTLGFGSISALAQKSGTSSKTEGSELVEFCARFWIEGDYGFESMIYMTESAFQTERDRRYGQGYRLKDLEIREREGRLSYSAIWGPGQGSELCLTGLGWQQLEQIWEQNINQGLVLTDLETYTFNNVRYFAGVWQQGETNQQAILGPVDTATFDEHHQLLVNQGFHLADVEVFEYMGKPRMMGVWDYAAKPGIFLHDLTWNAFHKNFHDLNEQNYRLHDFESYLIDGQAYYSGLWYPSDRPDLLVILDSSWSMDQYPNETQLDGYSLIDIEIFVEDSTTESHHEEPVEIGLSFGKTGVIISPTGPTGTLMPLHNGGSTGPGN